MAQSQLHHGQSDASASLMVLISRALRLLLVGLIFFLLVRIVMIWMTPNVVWTAPRPIDVSLNQGPAQTALTNTVSLSFDPFHRDVIAAPQDFGEQAPETSLNLKLTGRRAGPNGAAILETPDRQQGQYYIGDEIISGVTLEAVYADYIVISSRGQLERLTFNKESQTGLMSEASSSPGNAPELAAMSAADGSQRDPSIPAQPRSNSPILSPASLLSTAISLSPVMESGQTTGYRIATKADGFDLSPYGLKAGDVVVAINGESLTNGAESLAPILSSLSRAQSALVTVRRNGMNITVKVGT